MKDSNQIHEGPQSGKYLKNVPWYILGSISTKAIAFFLLPVFTKYLTPEDFGVLANLESFGRLIPVVLSLYLDSAFGRYYFQERESILRVRRLYSTHFWFILIWGGCASLVLLAATHNVLNSLLGVTVLPIIIIIFTSLFSQLALMVMAMWRANLMSKNISILQISTSLLSVGITLYLLVYENYGWQARIYGIAGMTSMQFALLLIYVVKKRMIDFTFDIAMLKRSLLFSIPLIPNLAAGWIAGFSDRIVLTYYGYLADTGLYSIAFQFAFILYILNDSITQVQGPIAFSGLTYDSEVAKKQTSIFLTIFLWIIFFFYLAITLFSKYLLEEFTSQEFHTAYVLVPILSIIYILSGVYRIFTNIILFHGRTWIISFGAIIQAILNILLNILFIPKFGMYAAAWSSVLSMAFYTIWIFLWAQSIDRIKIESKTISTIILLVICIMLLNQIIINSDIRQIFMLLGSAALLILYVLAVGFVKPLKPIKIKALGLIKSHMKL